MHTHAIQCTQICRAVYPHLQTHKPTAILQPSTDPSIPTQPSISTNRGFFNLITETMNIDLQLCKCTHRHTRCIRCQSPCCLLWPQPPQKQAVTVYIYIYIASLEHVMSFALIYYPWHMDYWCSSLCWEHWTCTMWTAWRWLDCSITWLMMQLAAHWSYRLHV